MGNFMKRLSTFLISMAISGFQIGFKTKQKSKYKVDFNFIFILIEKKYFGNVLNIFGENPVTNLYTTRDVLHFTANLTL